VRVAIDQSYIGRTYPPTEPYEVGREKIREFAAAIGDAGAIHRDAAAAREAGYPDVIAPPTFATIVNISIIEAIVGDPDLGVDYGRMVHADQRFTHRRPIRVGDRLVVVTHIDGILSRAGIDTLTVRGEISAEDGEPISTVRATLVFRGVGDQREERA
jgi:acyl dehydratase